MADKTVTRQLSIFINDREVVNSLGGINREIGKVNGQMRNLNKNSDSYTEDLARLKGELSQLKDRQAEFKEEIYDTNNAVDEASNAFSNLFVGLRTGNLGLVKEGITGIKNSIIGATKAGLAFIATPIGATVALLVGAFSSAKAIFEFNKGLEESNEKLRSLGVESENISKVRSEIEATAETFDKEFNDLAEKVKSLASTYGISMTEANNIIAQGLADGGALNDEFLDSLGEYDEFFAAAGFSAQEFINILNVGPELGIYTDKLPDALKEADLALKEQTDSTREALENAFGAAFTDDLLARIASGVTTTKEGLQEIAAQAKITGLTQQQQAQLTADVFKGAGEDAGGALKILEAIGQSATRELDNVAKSQLALVEANERLNKAQAELFEVEGFSDIWRNIQTVAIDALASVLEYIADVKEDIQPLIDLVGGTFTIVWENVKTAVGTAFDFISAVLRGFSSVIGGIVNFVKKLIEGDLIGAFFALKTGIDNAFKQVANFFIRFFNTLVDVISNFVDSASGLLEALGVDVDKLQQRIENLKGTEFDIVQNNQTNNTTTNETDNEVDAPVELSPTQAEINAAEQRRKAKEEADKKAAQAELDRRKALTEAKIALAQAEFDLFMANNQSKIEENGILTETLVAQETERLQRILDEQLRFNEAERQRAILAAQEKAKSEEELTALLQAINIDFNLRKQQIELEFQQQTDELKREYEEQKAVEQAEQIEAQREIDVENAKNKFDEQRIIQQQRYDDELADLNSRLDKGYLTEEQYEKKTTKLKDENAKIQKQIDESQFNNKLDIASDTFGNLADIFGRESAAGKAAAIAQTTIDTYQSATAAFKSLAGIPIVGPVLGGVAAAAAIAAGIANVRKITSTKQPKFFYGGHTGNAAALGYDEHGSVTGYVHANEWVMPAVMTQNPMYADTLSWLESDRRRLTGKGFVDGGSTSPGTLPTNINTTGLNDASSKFVETIDRLNSILESGIFAKLLIGYDEAEAIDKLNTERLQSDNNGTLSS